VDPIRFEPVEGQSNVTEYKQSKKDEYMSDTVVSTEGEKDAGVLLYGRIKRLPGSHQEVLLRFFFSESCKILDNHAVEGVEGHLRLLEAAINIDREP
ncbi:MAG: hypothetical protein LBI02_04905, partial [Opitutaceae bacterium]|jgi:hypothetical protein|nr:hypothetical protein [Opitutaceae bacterium]